MKKIKRDSKILSLSHNDLDGVTAQIVLGHIFKNIQYMNTSYYRINDVAQTLNYNAYDWVIMTDIAPSEKYIMDLSDNIILLDHHKTASQHHNPSNMRFVTENMCAAKFTKKFFEKYYNIKLTDLDEIVRLTNDYDMWIHNDPKSKEINDLMFYRYRPDKFRELYFDGHTNFNEDEINWLEKRKKEFKDLYNNLNIFEFDSIKGCVAESKEFINEISEKLLKEEGYRIIFIRNPSHGRISIRHNVKGLDVGTILQNHGWGGGHEEAAGMFAESIKQFKERTDILEKEIFGICEEIRLK